MTRMTRIRRMGAWCFAGGWEKGAAEITGAQSGVAGATRARKENDGSSADDGTLPVRCNVRKRRGQDSNLRKGVTPSPI